MAKVNGFTARVVLLLLGCSLVFLWSCGDGQTIGSPSAGGGAAPSITAPESSAKSFVSIGLGVETENGMEYLPPDPEQAKKFLREVSYRKTSNRIVTDPSYTSELYQLVGTDLCQLQGASQPYQAYTPESLLLGRFNGVTPRGFTSPILEHGIAVWTWTLPLPKPVFIFEQRQDGGIGGQFNENHLLDSNVLTYTVDYRWRQETVNGVTKDYFKVKSSVGDVVLFDSGEDEIQTPQGVFPLTPVFRSAYSGNYALSLSQNGTFIRSENYSQKGLQFDTTFPEVETTTGDPPEPIHITNSFHWDDFSPLVDPAWRAFVEVTGVGTVKSFGDTGQKPGANIDFTWSPAELFLAAARGSLARTIRLLPRAQCPYGCCGAARSNQDAQAREAQESPVYPYTVEASDPSYAGVRYRALRGGILPGQRLLLILDPQVTPETFEPDVIPEGATEPMKLRFSAQLATIGFNTFPGIEWQLHVRKKDTGEILKTFLPSDSHGASVRFPIVEWDGKVDGVPLNPDDYKFDLVATACESGGSDGGGSDVVAAKISKRPGDPGPCLLEEAEALFKVVPPVRVRALRFASNAALELDEANGPFRVYDYRQKADKGDLSDPQESQWRGTPPRETVRERQIPIVFRKGSSLFVGCQLDTINLPQSTRFLKVSLTGTSSFGAVAFVSSTGGQSFVQKPRSQVNTNTFFVFACQQPLPDFIGRHQLNLQWSVKFLDENENAFSSHTFSTPAERPAHVICTIFDNPLSGIDAFRAHPSEALSPWFDSNFFDENPTPSNSPGHRSPIDQATSWCQGATTKEQALEMLTRRIYQDGGWEYRGDDTYVEVARGLNYAFRDEFDYRGQLGVGVIQCSDVAMVLATYALHLGFEVSILDISPLVDESLLKSVNVKPSLDLPRFYTSYIRPIGGTQVNTEWVAPLSVVKTVVERPAITNTIPRLPPVRREFGQSFGGGRFAEFMQFPFVFHQAVSYHGLVYDPCARVVPGSGSVATNPDLYLNQRNVDEKSRFSDSHKRQLGIPPAASVLDRSTHHYVPGPFNDAELVIAVPQEQYINSLFYLADNAGARVTSGFNSANPIIQLVRDVRIIDE